MSWLWHDGQVGGATLSPIKPVWPHVRHRIAKDDVVEIEGTMIQL